MLYFTGTVNWSTLCFGIFAFALSEIQERTSLRYAKEASKRYNIEIKNICYKNFLKKLDEELEIMETEQTPDTTK